MSTIKILVGETDGDFVKQLKMRLQGKDYEIITREDGQAVIDKVHEDKPDLIIMNVSLPITSGYRVCTNLKHDFKYKKIPIILLGAKDSWKDRSYAKTIGAEDFLAKPLDYNDLIKRIQMSFSRLPMQELSVAEFGRKKVLIADNDKTLVKQLISRLEAHSFVKPDKYVSTTAENGQDVLDKISKDKPDLIAVGNDLAVINGYKLCRRLKEEPAYKRIPVIILSNATEEATEEEVKLAGANGYLIKPIDLKSFIQRIKWLLWEKK